MSSVIAGNVYGWDGGLLLLLLLNIIIFDFVIQCTVLFFFFTRQKTQKNEDGRGRGRHTPILIQIFSHSHFRIAAFAFFSCLGIYMFSSLMCKVCYHLMSNTYTQSVHHSPLPWDTDLIPLYLGI